MQCDQNSMIHEQMTLSQFVLVNKKVRLEPIHEPVPFLVNQ